MAVTAYASVVSLMNSMDQIQSHPSLSTCFNSHQFQFLRQNLDFFLNFVENYSDSDSNEAEDLMRRITDSALEAEDKIEVGAADRMRSGSTGKSLTFLFVLQRIIEVGAAKLMRRRSKKSTFLVLQRMIEDMNSIKEKVIKVKEETGLFTNSMPPPSSSAVAASPIATRKTKMVGFEDYLVQLLDELASSHSGRRILPIVGMGGIGKTTLARNAYENSLVLYRFDVRAWVTVSQDYDATEILSQALSCLGESNNRDDEAGEKLYKTLCGRRYLIVLDDVWSVEAWEKIKFSFPDNNNGSRIVVTTRQQEVVDYFASSAIAPNFLDHENSWVLFCEEAFGQESCPPELELVGRKIVEKCKGLPLAISVIGGLLGKSPRTPDYWEKIAQDRSLVLGSSSEGNQVLNILYLSYKNLPVCLKSCFLYMGLFPEDHRIDVFNLIQFFVAEGYIKANRKQSSEEVAESYIRKLVDRNLILVGELRQNKKVKTCYLHDLVRELCISLIVEKENFYCVQRCIDGSPPSPPYIFPHHFPPKRTSVIVPEIVNGQREGPFKSRLLTISYDYFRGHSDTSQQFNLRYLCLNCYSLPIPWSLSLCWSLQTLKSFAPGTLPSEIWTMPQLRHIEATENMYLPDPPKASSAIVLNNLQTLNTVNNLNFTEELCRRIPNIKCLGISYRFHKGDGARRCFNLHYVVCLNKLETLQISCIGIEYIFARLTLTLPSSLRELTLRGFCSLWWSDMAMLASLPHLQILQLYDDAVVGAEWSCVEQKFRCLKHIEINDCDDLIKWMAESSNFPVLETLVLWELPKLEEIPSGIGEIATLESIYLYDCSESVNISAMKILEEQESLGNESLRLRLKIRQYEAEEDIWREKYPLLIPTYPHFYSDRPSSVIYDSIPKTS